MVGQGSFALLSILLTLGPRKFANNGRILTKPGPIDRANTEISIGSGLVKIRPMLTKLRTLKVNSVNNRGYNQ